MDCNAAYELGQIIGAMNALLGVAVGGAIVLVAMHLWPTRRRERVKGMFEYEFKGEDPEPFGSELMRCQRPECNWVGMHRHASFKQGQIDYVCPKCGGPIQFDPNARPSDITL